MKVKLNDRLPQIRDGGGEADDKAGGKTDRTGGTRAALEIGQAVGNANANVVVGYERKTRATGNISAKTALA